MSQRAPGGYLPLKDRWGTFASQIERLPEGSVVLIDHKVAQRYPSLLRAVQTRRPAQVERLRGGEKVKRMDQAMQILSRAAPLHRRTTFLSIGGGTIGDLAAVVAHLHKRGAPLIHVPTTLLAAVDSSVGGKGAVDLATPRATVKNAVGVFHYPDECWLCPELFESLDERQVREGAIEAWKMVACLSAARWRAWLKKRPSLQTIIKDSRALKAEVCEKDPYETDGYRRVLNFGHTFAHALESISSFRVSHGDAVGMGMLCALDVGRVLLETPDDVAETVEEALLGPHGPVKYGRDELSRLLRRVDAHLVDEVLRADKKAEGADALTMVLLRKPGEHVVRNVPHPVWRGLFGAWKSGARP